VTQRLYTTGLAYAARNPAEAELDRSRSAELAWRADGQWTLRPRFDIEFGADAQRLSARHDRHRALNDAADLSPISHFDRRSHAAGVYLQTNVRPTSRLVITPGIRFDRWALTNTETVSPWISASLGLTPNTSVRAGTGRYRQFPDLEQVSGLQGGGDQLEPETARHLDIGIAQRLPGSLTLSAAFYARDEDDVLWTPGREPQRISANAIRLGRGDAPWTNVLEGRARGVELVLRRDAPTALSGWIGYAFGRHEYTRIDTGERFDADFDQRHALSVFGQYRLSSRSTIGAKFRYGSNYPLVGYLATATASPDQPPLFGGFRPLFYTLTTERNRLRLPAYARLDIRADRTFSWSSRRVTLFVEVANALNRDNLRNEPYGVDRLGRVFEPTGSLLPIIPSAGFVIEF
jgi:outer membrane receptor protein involved in Fe transport